MNNNLERKIAVIFATDVVGYSKHMKKDEDNTLNSFKACKDILEKLFKEHGGIIFNTAGDSILAEFSSAVSAVVCASEFQELIKERNKSEDTLTKLEFRVGINMGDVVKEGSNLYGDGVNIASRLETFSQPGGISLSKSVYEFVNTKTQFLFQDLGEQKVKDEIFYAYDIVLDASKKRVIKAKSQTKPMYVAGFFLAGLLIFSAFLFYNNQKSDIAKQEVISDPPVQRVVGRTMLIKPFEVRKKSEELNYIANGFTDHLITSLPSTILLNIIPRQKSYSVSEQQYTAERLRDELDVSFILGGSVIESKDKVRLNLELTNILNENIIWSSSEDFFKDDILGAQDSLERIVRRAIQANLTMGEAYISYYEKNFTDESDLIEIRKLDVATYKEGVSGVVKGFAEPYKKFVDKYENNAAALALFALRKFQEVAIVPSNETMGVFNEAMRAQIKALKIDPENARALYLKAFMGKILSGTMQKGLLEKAVEIAPESADVLAGVATAYRFNNEPLTAIGFYQKVLEIAPFGPSDFKLNLLRAYIDTEKFNEAEILARDMIASDKNSSYWGNLFLIYINHRNNNKDKALKFYKDFLRKNNTSIEKLADEIANYPWSWDVWYKTTLTDALKEIDKLISS